MNLLLVNDDGINAPGIKFLAKELEKHYNLTIVAPDVQRSACSHSITITRPLIVKESEVEGVRSKAYSVDGTPADCVRIALDKLVHEPIDMVISGINRGVNLGSDVLYSGTVSAAIEASINKIPSLAVSVFVKKNNERYDIAAEYAHKVIDLAMANKIGSEIVLNLNVPLREKSDIKGIKICKIGGNLFESYFIETRNGENDLSYTLGGKLKGDAAEDTDIHYLKNGYVTLTPLHYDLTNFSIFKDVEKWMK